MLDPARIQAQLRYSATQNYGAVPAPPFTIFINPDSDLPYANYAIPDVPPSGDLAAALAALRAAFAARGRRPRFEFVEEFAPELAQALRANGFVEESRTYLMICTRESFRQAEPVPGLTVSVVHAESPIAHMQDLMSVQHQAFGGEVVPRPTEAEAEQQLRRYAGTRWFLARLEGEAVGAASILPPYDGLTELAGVATLQEFRRRGVATELAAHATRAAFEQGVDTVFLTAADEHAGRVYARVGFQPIGFGLAYVEPAAS